MNREQFYGYVASRLGQSSVSTVPYIDSYYFNERSNLEMFIDFAKGGMEEFALEHLLIYAMPFLPVFVTIWVGCIVLSHNWKQRFCYTLCLMTMAVNLAIFVIMPDATRRMTATVLS